MAATSLGKRKRRAGTAQAATATTRSRPITKLQDELSSADEDDDQTRALFRRAFEAKFRPLENIVDPGKDAESSSDDDDGSVEDVELDGRNSDWGGLSDGMEDEVEIVEFSRVREADVDEGRRKRNGFMSSKPPSSSSRETDIKPTQASTKPGESENDGSEATNLKHDLALQRLLKESHLLDPATFHSSALEPQGKARLKALDMRLRDLGAKKSLLQQEKMPMSHRKGIIAKATDREALRRREATENGIVLEKARKNAKPSTPKRTRGIGGPTVGKFKGGTLSLSARDVKSIEGQRMGGSGRKKGRR